MPIVLAGDIGGTKTNLGLFEVGPQGLRAYFTASFRSADFPSLGAVLVPFLAAAAAESPGDRAATVVAACFGVAGPVIGNRARTPNLAWVIDGATLAAEAQLGQVLLINDLVATALGIPLLAADELAVLHPGDPAAARVPGNRVLIAAGTGLGMALLPLVGGTHVPVPSEGGHADFPPQNALEAELWSYLRQRFTGHVSIERVISGPGLFSIYEYLRDSGYAPETAAVRQALLAGEEPAQVVGEAGLVGSCGLCVRALDIFASAYGAAAGNLALLGTATGGVFVGGGIAPKILPRLQDGAFVSAFKDKGRFVEYLERIPVRVILNPRVAMLGAARRAADLLGG
ncbi:MAG: glucokinase [Acidobacteriota bacterium]|nr:glucokinase [Acidobacteriota bacterium]